MVNCGTRKTYSPNNKARFIKLLIVVYYFNTLFTIHKLDIHCTCFSCSLLNLNFFNFENWVYANTSPLYKQLLQKSEQPLQTGWSMFTHLCNDYPLLEQCLSIAWTMLYSEIMANNDCLFLLPFVLLLILRPDGVHHFITDCSLTANTLFITNAKQVQ